MCKRPCGSLWCVPWVCSVVSGLLGTPFAFRGRGIRCVATVTCFFGACGLARVVCPLLVMFWYCKASLGRLRPFVSSCFLGGCGCPSVVSTWRLLTSQSAHVAHSRHIAQVCSASPPLKMRKTTIKRWCRTFWSIRTAAGHQSTLPMLSNEVTNYTENQPKYASLTSYSIRIHFQIVSRCVRWNV